MADFMQNNVRSYVRVTGQFWVQYKENGTTAHRRLKVEEGRGGGIGMVVEKKMGEFGDIFNQTKVHTPK